MSLREDIAHLIEEVIVDPLQYQSITQSDRIINKILDAVVADIDSMGGSQIFGNEVISKKRVLRAINKLRGK